MSRPGDLSTDIAGVGDGTGNVISFDVSLYILPLTFFAALIAGKNSFVSVSASHFFLGPCHHGLDLFIQLMSF